MQGLSALGQDGLLALTHKNSVAAFEVATNLFWAVFLRLPFVHKLLGYKGQLLANQRSRYAGGSWLQYGVAYLLVGYQVIRSAIQSIPSGNVFNGFLLISIATTGAFTLG